MARIFNGMPDVPLVTIQRLVRELEDNQIPYAIIGGVAVSIRAVPRYTEDVDAVVWVDDSRRSEFLAQITKRGLRPRASDPLGFARKNRLLLLTDEDGVHVDLSFGVLPFEEEMIRNAEPIEIAEGCTASIATARALVLMKAVAWRSKDLHDIVEIVSVNPDEDWGSVVDEFVEFAELLDAAERVEELRRLVNKPSL